MKRTLVAFGSGLLFALGLGFAGMLQPSKIVGFLDFTGAWDASLAFVMVGGIGVLMLAQVAARRLGKPLLAESFPVLKRNEIDGRLFAGAALFGIGWGLGGYCPGPAVTSCGAGLRAAALFVPAMVAGMGLVRWLDARRKAPVEEEAGPPPTRVNPLAIPAAAPGATVATAAPTS